MKLKYPMTAFEMSGNYVAVADDMSQYGGILHMNRTAADIVENLSEETTQQDLTNMLMEKYITDEITAQCSVQKTLSLLWENDLLDVGDIESIGIACRDSFEGVVIGVTGSVGKTCTKDMIATVLQKRKRVLKTYGNLNCGQSIPFLLSGLGSNYDVCVAELGISKFGEMSEYARQLRPTIGVFTGIGNAHLESLGSREGVYRAKTEMLEFMPDDAMIVINGDDDILCRLKDRQNVLTYGLGEQCDVRAEDILVLPAGNVMCTISYRGRSVKVCTQAYGRHLVYSAAAAAAVGYALGLNEDEISRGVADYRTHGRRGIVNDTGYITLIDDSYNSNPDSLKCAVDSLVGLDGRHVCVLADMGELGEKAKEYHDELGRYIRESGIEQVMAYGQMCRVLCRTVGRNAVWFDTQEKLIEALPQYIQAGDRILVKGKHAMNMDKVADALMLMHPVHKM